jgi:hypothetical protein
VELPLGRFGKQGPPEREYGAAKGIIWGSIWAYFAKQTNINTQTIGVGNLTVLRAFFGPLQDRKMFFIV